MAMDGTTGATIDRVDGEAWEFRRAGRAHRVGMQPDGPFRRVVAMPDPGADPPLVAANLWAMGEMRAELARDGVEARFTIAPGG